MRVPRGKSWEYCVIENIYVLANGDLFREAFNAIVTVMHTGKNTFFSDALKIAILFSILGAAINYIKVHDLAVFAKWFAIYFVIINIFLGIKTTVHINDSSNPMANDYIVDNVPLGLALPASIITSIAHGMVNEFETVFYMPDGTPLLDAMRYSKSGMLFGSHLLREAQGFRFVNTDIRNKFEEYFKNCIIGDIVIAHKYSFKDLVNTPDLLTQITSDTSPMRGVLDSNGSFATCKQAAADLKKNLDAETKTDINIFGRRIFGDGVGTQTAEKLLRMGLTASFSYFFQGYFPGVETVVKQILLINGIADSVLSYVGQTQATASLINVNTAKSTQKMSMAASRNNAAYVLTLMQTNILLILICIFPLVILLSINMGIGLSIFKNYIYSLIWVESWPILFACLHMATSFYLQNKTAGIAAKGFVMSNTDALALEHSDIANMAGYLMMSVPLIAAGIVKGMSSIFSSIAFTTMGAMQASMNNHASRGVSENTSEGASGELAMARADNHNNAHNFDANASGVYGTQYGHGHAQIRDKVDQNFAAHTNANSTINGFSAHDISSTKTSGLSNENANHTPAATSAHFDYLNQRRAAQMAVKNSEFMEQLKQSANMKPVKPAIQPMQLSAKLPQNISANYGDENKMVKVTAQLGRAMQMPNAGVTKMYAKHADPQKIIHQDITHDHGHAHISSIDTANTHMQSSSAMQTTHFSDGDNHTNANKPKVQISSLQQSADGANFIKLEECASTGGKPILTAHGDGTKHAGNTIGYGHYIKKGEHFTKITKEQAEDLFRSDIAEAEKLVKKHVHADLTQNQYDALVSLAYNSGAGGLKKAAADINSNNFENVGHDMAQVNKAKIHGHDHKDHLTEMAGLNNRREDEINLFYKGDYAVSRAELHHGAHHGHHQHHQKGQQSEHKQGCHQGHLHKNKRGHHHEFGAKHRSSQKKDN